MALDSMAVAALLWQVVGELGAGERDVDVVFGAAARPGVRVGALVVSPRHSHLDPALAKTSRG